MPHTAILFPHQLFREFPQGFKAGKVYLVEEYLFFRQYSFHKQKIAFHRASMKAYENFLAAKGYKVEYVESGSELSDIRKLIPEIAGRNAEELLYIDPVDDWLEKRLKRSADEVRIRLRRLKSPMFLNSEAELDDFFKTKQKKFLHAQFYRKERLKRNILLKADGSPIGGKWSFDAENRKRYPSG
ncbi:MAG: cryptochrome/photolyase family protein, partial [bacterium]